MLDAHVALTAAAAIAAVMITTWLVSLPLRNVSIVDIVWGPVYVVVAWVVFATGDGSHDRTLLLAVLVSLWGLRLGLHLARRNIGHGEDKRYVAMREKHGSSFPLRSLFMVFLLQGAIAWIVSLPLQVAASDPSPAGLGPLEIAGVAVFALGLFFEAVGDHQLARFSADPSNKGKVLDTGLWRYTRHPNYFGDATVWWGIWLVALGSGSAWWTAVGPALMTFFIVKVSGAGLLEKTIGSRRAGYDEYIRRTSGFIPRPPKR